MELTAERLSRRARPSAQSGDFAALAASIEAARGLAVWVPVIVGGRLLAMLRGKPDGSAVDVRLPPRPLRLDEVPWSCAITSYQALLNAVSASKVFSVTFSQTPSAGQVAGNWYDLWPVSGAAKAAGGYTGTASTATPLGNTNSNLFQWSSVGSNTLYLLSWLDSLTGNTPVMLLYDRVLVYDSCPVTAGTTTLTNTASAGRYISAGQPGLQMVFTAQTAFAAGANTFNAITYVDNAGNPGQTVPTAPIQFVGTGTGITAPSTTLGARVIGPATSSGATTILSAFMPLGTGQTGCRSVTNFACSAANTGLVSLVLAYPIAYIPVLSSAATSQMETLSQVAYLPIVSNNACLELMMYAPSSTGFTNYATMNFVWG
jgi:hypothetical protein